MKSSDVLFAAAAMFLGVSLFQFFYLYPDANAADRTTAYLNLLCSMLFSLSVYAGIVGLTVAVRWSRRDGDAGSTRAPHDGTL